MSQETKFEPGRTMWENDPDTVGTWETARQSERAMFALLERDIVRAFVAEVERVAQGLRETAGKDGKGAFV